MNEKDKAIAQAMASIQNRLRHVYNQGFEDGRKAKRKTGKWKRVHNHVWECTTEDCGMRVSIRTPYCAYCGAKMEAEE